MRSDRSPTEHPSKAIGKEEYPTNTSVNEETIINLQPSSKDRQPSKNAILTRISLLIKRLHGKISETKDNQREINKERFSISLFTPSYYNRLLTILYDEPSYTNFDLLDNAEKNVVEKDPDNKKDDSYDNFLLLICSLEFIAAFLTAIFLWKIIENKDLAFYVISRSLLCAAFYGAVTNFFLYYKDKLGYVKCFSLDYSPFLVLGYLITLARSAVYFYQNNEQIEAIE